MLISVTAPIAKIAGHSSSERPLIRIRARREDTAATVRHAPAAAPIGSAAAGAPEVGTRDGAVRGARVDVTGAGVDVRARRGWRRRG